MGTSAFRTYSNSKLVPVNGSHGAREIPVQLAASGSYPKGTRLVETGTQGVYQAWSTALAAAAGTVLTREVPAVAAGNDNVIVLGPSPIAGTVLSVSYTPAATVTGAATNNRTISVINEKASGTANVTVASLNFGNGTNAPVDQATPVTLSGTPANLAIAAGDVLVFSSAHVGTGIADPGGTVTITIAPPVTWQGIIAYDAQTDASGNITLSPTAGQVLGDEYGQFAPSVPAWFGGVMFLQSDLPNFGAADLAAAPPGTRIESGTIGGNTALIYIP